MIYRREMQICKNEHKNRLKIFTKKCGKKSFFVLYILYTDKTFAKESKSHGFYTYKRTTETKLPELVTFNFGKLGFYFSRFDLLW